MQADPLIALLHRLNENSNAVAAAVEEVGIWIGQRGSTDVTDRINSHLSVLRTNSDMVVECMAELLVRQHPI